MSDLVLTPAFERAHELLSTSRDHIFLTGKAGTGKSTFLQYVRAHLQKRMVVLAPTGIAALNVGGQTIHSFFGWKPHTNYDELKPSKKLRELLAQIDVIVIDEISMVRADMLDGIDRSLRLHREGSAGVAFGGIQVLAIGDLYQLPPIVMPAEAESYRARYDTPYFFGANVIRDQMATFEFVEFEEIFRQRDPVFIDLLNRVRNATPTRDDLTLLNARVTSEDQGGAITLTTTNALALAVNESALDELTTSSRVFEGEILGSFDAGSLPTDIELSLKIGARVMFLANDNRGRWVNGSLGTITAFTTSVSGEDRVVVEIDAGEEVTVEPYTWELSQYALDDITGVPTQRVVGTFTQFPMKLAWAITIHKSQGKTFDRVRLDIGRGAFAHGQVYVALSRSRSLEGLTLVRPVLERHITIDPVIQRFLTGIQYRLAAHRMSREERIEFIESAILSGRDIEMIYLKGSDEKSSRRITPLSIGQMVHHGKSYLGLVAYCHVREDERVFAVAKILEMRLVEEGK